MCRLVLPLRAPACRNRVVPVRASRWPLRHPQKVGKKQFLEGASLGFAAELALRRGHSAYQGTACAVKPPLGETTARCCKRAPGAEAHSPQLPGF